MKLYKTTITPLSNFSTTLKGDTLFGQMCWAVRYALGNDRLEALLNKYETDPFLVVSDGFARGYLPKPSMPSRYLNENSDEKKENRKKIWMNREDLRNGKYTKAKTNSDVGNLNKTESIVRNSINYKTSTTGADGFDPYGENETRLTPQDIYFLINDDFTLDELKKSLDLLSGMGYGKDSTIGKGRFDIGEFEEIDTGVPSATYMALSPFSPSGMQYKELFYEPFTRFGKSGASRANTNPFKRPILMADSATVIHFDVKKELNYVGQAIKNVSSYSDIVHQGYAIVVPMKELSNE